MHNDFVSQAALQFISMLQDGAPSLQRHRSTVQCWSGMVTLD